MSISHHIFTYKIRWNEYVGTIYKCHQPALPRLVASTMHGGRRVLCVRWALTFHNLSFSTVISEGYDFLFLTPKVLSKYSYTPKDNISESWLMYYLFLFESSSLTTSLRLIGIDTTPPFDFRLNDSQCSTHHAHQTCSGKPKR